MAHIYFYSISFPTVEVLGSSKYLLLCLNIRNVYRFGMTWGWENNEDIFIFGWTIPLKHDIMFIHTTTTKIWPIASVTNDL